MNTNYDNLKAIAMNDFEIETHLTTETVNDITSQFYQFTDYKKDKNGNLVPTTVQIRDVATASALTNIDLFSGMAKMSIKGFVIELARISKEQAKKACGGSVVDLVSKIHKEYSRTTLNSYRRIGLMFWDRESEDKYSWRAGIPQDVSVNNLLVVLALASQKKDLEELKPEEIDTLYQDFYARYIATGEIILTTTQSELKKQVKDITNGIIEGKAEEVKQEQEQEHEQEQEQEHEQEQEQEQEEEVTDKEVKRFDSFLDDLAYYSEYFKSEKKVVDAIAKLVKALSDIQK